MLTQEERKHWRKLVEEVEDNPFGEAYKLLAKKLRLGRRTAQPELEEQMRVVRDLFPSAPVHDWQIGRGTEEAEGVTDWELNVAASKISSRKAPGPDGVPPVMVKMLAEEEGLRVRQALSDVLWEGIFPKCWKGAGLVLIPKKAGSTATRPICLLSAVGKLAKLVVVGRLKEELKERGALSERQHGFRAGRSTERALKEVKNIAEKAEEGTWRTRELSALLTLDVRNAFNSTRWEHIIDALTRKDISAGLVKVMVSYLLRARGWAQKSQGAGNLRSTTGIRTGADPVNNIL